MSDLLDLLGPAEQNEVAIVFDESLDKANCPLFSKTHAGSFAAIFEALQGCCETLTETPARKWAALLYDEALTNGIPRSEVWAGLNAFERAVRFHIVKTVNQKPQLLAAMGQLSDIVDALRRCYVDACFDEQVGAPQTDAFVALAHSVDSFICMATLHGKPFYINPAGCRLIGLEEEDPELSTSLHDWYDDDSWDELQNIAVPAVKETGQWEGQSRIRNVRSGKFVYVMTTMLLVRGTHTNRATCLAILHRDASDQLRLERELAESQARKHAILESALDPIITIDGEGFVTEFNRAAEETFGHPRSKVLGTQPSDMLFPPSKSARHQNRIDRYLDAGEGSLLGHRIEVTAVRANGETFPAEMAMTISHEQGAPVLTFFVRDISKRKRAEEEQAHYEAELKRSNQELEQFAYAASHDLQEPLRKIRTFCDRLEMKSGDQLDPIGKECVTRMQSAACRMQALIEGLLTLSRVTSRGKHFEQVALNEVLHEVLSDLEIRIERTQGRVIVGDLPTLVADHVQMRQLLQNLIGNALKFHRSGVPPVVEVHGELFNQCSYAVFDDDDEGDTHCRILIEDNGIGFEERHIERVFGIFQRLHPRDVYEGTGIGLPICRKIVERHKGTITAKSLPGKGTTFEVVLPVSHSNREED